jgi:ASC-1-like (ASCH) protein
MIHEMRLDPAPFEEIAFGKKLIESRLNDEKRQKIKVGDIIEFSKGPDCVEKIKVKVLELNKYKTIKDFVDNSPIELWGPRFKTREQLMEAPWGYPKEEIEKYGFLGIKMKLLD